MKQLHLQHDKSDTRFIVIMDGMYINLKYNLVPDIKHAAKFGKKKAFELIKKNKGAIMQKAI